MSRALSRPAVAGAMLVGVVAISTSAVLARWAMGDDPGVVRPGSVGAASALGVAFWRCALGAVALAPAAARAASRRPRPLPRTRRRQLAASGLALGLHFALFQGSLALTTVASAVTLATMSPILVAVGAARFLGEPAGRRVLVGLALTIAGAVTIGAGDLSASDLGRQALLGDLLAFGSAIAVAGYLLLGRVARQEITTSEYSAAVYGVAAVALGAVAVLLGVPLWGFDAPVWAAIAGIVLGPQLLGHTVFNGLLAHVSATVVSVVVLSEPVGAAVLAWLLLDELPAAAFAVGAPLVLAGVLLAATRRRRPPPAASPDAPVATDRT